MSPPKIICLFLRLHPMEAECVCEYDNSNAKADSLPVSLWRVNMSLHVSKR